jgi:hypothetical protein
LISAGTLGDVLGAALRDLWPALRSWIWWMIAIVVVTVSAVIFAALINPPTDAPSTVLAYQWESGSVIAIGIACAAFFALASAVRTVKPDFRMTPGRFFGVIGWSLFSAVMILGGLILLIVPGLYLIVRVSLAPYFYLLDGGQESPVKESLARTRGHFWLTALVLFAVALATQVVAYVAGAMVGLLALIAPVAALVAVPLMFIAVLASVQFSYNAYARWAHALKLAATMAA